jgi:hypothetical protein
MDVPGGGRLPPATAFMCPICKCVNFKEVVVPRGEGYYRTAFFECCGCSAMFHDPAKFSVDRDAKARREMAEGNQGNRSCD